MKPYKHPVTILDTRRARGLPSSSLNRRRSSPWQGYLIILIILGAFWAFFAMFVIHCFK